MHEHQGEPPATSDLRVRSILPLASPADVRAELPLTDRGAASVTAARREIVRILDGREDRLLVVVGPCSVHDRGAVLDYAERLRRVADELADDLCLVMRVYFEKPRTTVGWKGLVNDPHLDGSFAVDEGLRQARQLLLDLVGLGLPAGCEFLDPISPQFLADAVSWAAIGARTAESQVHRELASGLSMPVGFKNGTDGRVQVALEALYAAARPHSFLGVTEDGRAAVVTTTGNPDCHLILRGGNAGSNHDAASVAAALGGLRALGLPPRVMVDARPGNSGQDHRRQPAVAPEIADQVAAGEAGVVGVMLESFLVDGRQELADRAGLVYGQSVTDACMGWDMTLPVLRDLARAARARRARAATASPTLAAGVAAG